MSASLEVRLEAELAGREALQDRFRARAGDFLLRYGARTAPLARETVSGLARALGSHPSVAGLLARREVLFERLASLSPKFLLRRQREFDHSIATSAASDLEGFLDEIRLLRRDDTLLVACLDLAGAAAFPEVSTFLSRLAEGIVVRVLDAAVEHTGGESSRLAVLAMGKLAGREFTYHSDLDLIFLADAPAEDLSTVTRTARRLIAYLTTMTGAGIAYPVDTRLRPSGNQGVLVTTFDGFERYQLEHAQTWEHLALLRSRVIAGPVQSAQERLEGIREKLLQRRPVVWEYVRDMRERIERERAQEAGSRVAIKTGSGGIMDIEFLAGAGLLESGSWIRGGELPSVPRMLVESAGGACTERLLAHYRFLREVEARTRWVADRPVEVLDLDSETAALVAELMGLGLEELASALRSARREVRGAFERVSNANSIRALSTGGGNGPQSIRS